MTSFPAPRLSDTDPSRLSDAHWEFFRGLGVRRPATTSSVDYSDISSESSVTDSTVTDSSTDSLLYGDPDSPFRDPDMVALDPGAERRDGKLGDIEHLISTGEAGPALRERLQSQDWELGELNPEQENRLLGCLRSLPDPTDQARAMEGFGSQLAQASSGFREKLLGVIEEMSQAPEFTAGRHAVPMAILNCVGSNAFSVEQCGRLSRYLDAAPSFDNNVFPARAAIESALEHAPLVHTQQAAGPAAAAAVAPPLEVVPGESQLGGLEAAFRNDRRPLSSAEARDAMLGFPLQIDDLDAAQQGRLWACLNTIEDPRDWAAALREIGPKLAKTTPEFRQAVLLKIGNLSNSPDPRASYAIADAAVHCVGAGAEDLTTEELEHLQACLFAAPDGYAQRGQAEQRIRSVLQARQPEPAPAVSVVESVDTRLQGVGRLAARAARIENPADRSAAMRDAVLHPSLEIDELNPAQQEWLFGLLKQIEDPLDWAAAMKKIGPRLSKATPEFRGAVLEKIGHLRAYPPGSRERYAIADAASHFAGAGAEDLATEDLRHLQACLEAAPPDYANRGGAERNIGRILQAREPAPAPVLDTVEPRESHLREAESHSGWAVRIPDQAQRSAAMRDAVLNSPIEIDALDPAQQKRVFDLLGRIENPGDWAAAMRKIGPKLGRADPLFRASVLGKIRDFSNSRNVHSDRLAVADFVVNCAGPSAAELTTEELLDLRDSLGRVPDYYAPRHAGEWRIGTELYARQPAQPPMLDPAMIHHAVMNGGPENAIAAIEGLANPRPSPYPYPGHNNAHHVDGALGTALYTLNSRIEHVASKFHDRIANSLNAIKHPGYFASAVSGFGGRLSKAGRKVQTVVFDRIDAMGKSLTDRRDHAVEAAVGASIIYCAGPSAAVFTPAQRASLLRHADRLDPNGVWRGPAMNSLRDGWPRWPFGQPGYDETLALIRPPPPVPPRPSNRPPVPPSRPQAQGARPGGMAPLEEERLFARIDRNTDPTAWAEALSSEIGDRFGTLSPERREMVLDRIDGMMGATAYAGATAIVGCSGRSVATLMPAERGRLVRSALSTSHTYSYATVTALVSLRAAWPDVGPTFEQTLRLQPLPDWAGSFEGLITAMDDVVEEREQRLRQQSLPPERPPPAARSKGKKKRK